MTHSRVRSSCVLPRGRKACKSWMFRGSAWAKPGSGIGPCGAPNQKGKSYEVLLPMRQGVGRRSALLFQMWADLRRSPLPSDAPEFSLRGRLFPMRLSRAIRAATTDLGLVEGAGVSGQAGLWDLPCVRLPDSTCGPAPTAADPGGAPHCWCPRGIALVGLEPVAGMASEVRLAIHETKGARR